MYSGFRSIDGVSNRTGFWTCLRVSENGPITLDIDWHDNSRTTVSYVLAVEFAQFCKVRDRVKNGVCIRVVFVLYQLQVITSSWSFL